MSQNKYESHVKPYLDNIFFWYSNGWTMDAIADELNVNVSTLYDHKNKYPEFSDVLKRADQVKPKAINNKAKRALKDKLEDREVEETHTEIWKDGDGNVIKQHVKKVKKVIPADTTAMIFALKNTDPENWGDKKQIEMQGGLSISQREQMAEEFLSGLMDDE